MAEEITFCTLNCQGLGGREKRKDVLNFLKQKKYSIYCLQDTHFTGKEENYIRSQWGYEAYFSSFTSQARGVAIFINNNFEYKLHKIKTDREGNKIILDISIKEIRVTLINVYGPNKDTPVCFEQIRHDITDFNNNYIILTGDLNLALQPEIDTMNYTSINNPKSRDKVLDICAEVSLVDIWRELNMEKRQYTWRTKNGNKRGRLDYFLISEELFTMTENAFIEMGYRSDHCMVTWKLKGKKDTKPQSFWKFNNSLLKDKEYVKIIKKLIYDIKTQYADIPPNTTVDNFSNKDLKFSISDQLFLEVLMMEIRGKTISYASFNKKRNNTIENNLIKEISDLESMVDVNIDILEQKRKDLQDIRQKRLDGLFIRSRAKWIDEGEKNSKYFCNLENRNFISKCMPNLWKSDGTKTVD